MRKRAMRDLGTVLGVVVILAGVLGANMYMRLESLKEKAIKIREKMEAGIRKDGTELLEWDLLRETKGTMKKGATFSEGLKARDDHLVHIVGFMTPIDQFRNVERFMLLPMPIYCYFCESPPMRDVLLIQMRDGTKVKKMWNEPILVHGDVKLYAEAGEPFFYAIEDAGWGKADEGRLTEKIIEERHRKEMLQMGSQMMQGVGQGGQTQHIEDPNMPDAVLPPERD